MKIPLLILWTMILALSMYDGFTTFILLEHDGKELNWFANWFIEMCGPGLGLLYVKSGALLLLTFVTGWIVDQSMNLRQKIVVIGLYLIAIGYYSYNMYNINHIYMKSFSM